MLPSVSGDPQPIYDHPFSSACLGKMGLSLGADVPFFLFGRPAIAKGIGERLVHL